MRDVFDLQRFIDAQNPIYESVLSELRAGRKKSHWMWYVFPQISGLGDSAMSRAYAITSIDEAKAYWAHPVLGSRLSACTRLVQDVQGRSIEDIFGYPDHLKFHSSMTLFDRAAPGGLFKTALATYFDGATDPSTIAILARLMSR
jgi:uncharacterized protein (DUF1810 family)